MSLRSLRGVVGPVKIIFYGNCKMEGVCHICKWSWMDWAAEDVRQKVLAHIETHLDPQVYEPKVSEMPGQGAGCN